MSTPPTPTPPPPPSTAPIITDLAVQGTRPKGPANVADASEEVVVTATVTAETPVDRLTFEWSSPVGGFSGTGPTVRWRAPASVPAPFVATLQLRVVDGTQRVERTVEVRVHDHVREVGDLATLFLRDFSDSAIPVATVMRNFLPGCYGTEEETSDVLQVRRDYVHVQTRIDPPVVAVDFAGVCPYQNRRGDACSTSFVRWETRKTSDGSREVVEGHDQVAAVYRQDRWWLCDSRWDGRRLFGSGDFYRLLTRESR